MTASYQHLALSHVKAGMVLSDELLDKQGHVLLPQGSVLTEAMLALMPRHGIDILPIALAAPAEAELQAERAGHQLRLDQLFRKNDADSDADWATGLLRRYAEDYRLGRELAE
ncbi:MAG: hypothetical protein V4754_15755 [Pseudomonadota bacterium]